MLTGHLFQRGQHRVWYLKIRVNKIQKLVKLGIMSAHEAQRARREKLDDLEKNFYKDLKKATFKELSDKWLVTLENSGLKPKTLVSYKERLKVHLLPSFGSMLLSNITPDKVESLKLEMSKKISARTVNYTLRIFKVILEKGIHWGYIYRNPLALVSRLKQRKPEFKALTRDEVAKLLQAAEGQSKTLLMMAVLSGLRQGEILGARWKNMNFDKGSYTVTESFSEFGFDRPKTESSLRTIPLPKPLLEELRKHRVRQNERRLRIGPAWDNNDLIFTTEIGTPIDPHNLRNRIFLPILKKSGLEKVIRFHDLRGTAATLALESGANVRAVQNLLGHSTARLTLEVYAKANPDSMKDLAEKLGAYVGVV